MGLEPLLKARLMLDDWTRIVAKPEAADPQSFAAGDFQSVSMPEAIVRIRRLAGGALTETEIECFRAVQRHRNKLAHFYHKGYAKNPPDTEAIREVAKEQCKAWFYLYRLLMDRWAPHFRRYSARPVRSAVSSARFFGCHARSVARRS